MKLGAHFVVNGVEGCLITICGEVIPPAATVGAQVGVYGPICLDCEKKVKEAWVTIK